MIRSAGMAEERDGELLALKWWFKYGVSDTLELIVGDNTNMNSNTGYKER
jgi:hypothetical protein